MSRKRLLRLFCNNTTTIRITMLKIDITRLSKLPMDKQDLTKQLIDLLNIIDDTGLKFWNYTVNIDGKHLYELRIFKSNTEGVSNITIGSILNLIFKLTDMNLKPKMTYTEKSLVLTHFDLVMDKDKRNRLMDLLFSVLKK